MTATFDSVPVIDVNKHNVKEVWPSMEQAIKTATFIAIDTELSGIGTRKVLMAKSVEERYAGTAENAKSCAVVSLGLSCFKLMNVDSSHTGTTTNISTENGTSNTEKKVAWNFLVQTYNIMTLCQENYMVNPASLKFLVEHGFDFNKQYSTGVPYYRGNDQVDKCTKEDFPLLRELFTNIVLSKKTVVFHNALMDLVFLYQNFYANLPQKMSSFLADLTEIFPGGILDTKYITDYVHRMPASYLEYVFRKSQRDNARRFEERSSCVAVNFPVYPASAAVNHCSCKLPTNNILQSNPDPSAVERLKSSVCQTFAGHGWCASGTRCNRSHDIDLILDVDYLVQSKKSRKRKRRKDKKDNDSLSGTNDQEDMESDEEEMPMKDIKVEKSLDSGTDNTCDAKLPNICQAGCHRAGFDAFMTGFSLAVYLSQYGEFTGSFDLNDCNINKFKNCLYLSGKDMPLTVVKSAFSKTSKDHRDKMERIQNR